MKFGVLALDYDGTIADHDVLDSGVRAAIAAARAQGIVVVLVTGRILADLRRVAGDLRIVDAVVAENGAVIAFPASGRTAVLGEPAPEAFLEGLRRRGLSAHTGESVVELDASAAAGALEVIRETGAPLVQVFNRARQMVLPRGITKGIGLRRALRTLRLSVHNAIGIGDAENDHDLLRACEIGVAVGWGSESLKAGADEVLEGHGPPDVAAYIRRALAKPRLSPASAGRRRLLLGHHDGDLFSLAVRDRNVLVTGDPRSGKSWVTGLLCEQLIFHEYSVCVIDPEGDYTGLEALPSVTVLGGHGGAPRPRDLLTAMRHPDASVILDLSQIGHDEKVDYITTLLPTLAELRRRTGIPHRIVVDEAHYFLHEPDLPRRLDLELGGYTLTSYQPARLHPAVLSHTEAHLVTRTTDADQAAALAQAAGIDDVAGLQQILGSLQIGEAVVLPDAKATSRNPKRLHLIARLTPHTRHRQKYLDVPVTESRAFVFASRGARPGERPRTLRAFAEALTRTPEDVAAGHAARSDFSRWIADVFGDHRLAAGVRKAELQHRIGWTTDLQDAIIAAIRERYEVSPPDL